MRLGTGKKKKGRKKEGRKEERERKKGRKEGRNTVEEKYQCHNEVSPHTSQNGHHQKIYKQ